VKTKTDLGEFERKLIDIIKKNSYMQFYSQKKAYEEIKCECAHDYPHGSKRSFHNPVYIVSCTSCTKPPNFYWNIKDPSKLYDEIEQLLSEAIR